MTGETCWPLPLPLLGSANYRQNTDLALSSQVYHRQSLPCTNLEYLNWSKKASVKRGTLCHVQLEEQIRVQEEVTKGAGYELAQLTFKCGDLEAQVAATRQVISPPSLTLFPQQRQAYE